MKRRPLVLALAALLAGAALGDTASAGPARIDPRDWHDVKCRRYGRAWASALARTGTKGIGQDFLARHAAFLASNCTARPDVCPRSRQELELANRLVVLSMNFGAASTFVPFACH